MNATSVVARFARRWAAIYTFWLPAETRDRRREELPATCGNNSRTKTTTTTNDFQRPLPSPSASFPECKMTFCGEQENDDQSGGSNWDNLRADGVDAGLNSRNAGQMGSGDMGSGHMGYP